MLTTSASVSGAQEIDAAKHRLSKAKSSADFARQIKGPASEKLATARANLEAIQSQLKDAQSQFEAAKSHMELVDTQVLDCEKEVVDAESNLEKVEKKWGVIEIEETQGGAVAGRTSAMDADYVDDNNPDDNSNQNGSEENSDESSSEFNKDDELTNQADDSHGNERGGDEGILQPGSASIIVTQFHVTRCGYKSFNGHYKMHGTYPSCKTRDGAPIYVNSLSSKGNNGRYVLSRFEGIHGQKFLEIAYWKDVDNKGMTWLHDYRSEGHAPEGNCFLKEHRWHNTDSHNPTTMKVEPIRGLDENGTEIKLTSCASKEELEQTRIVVEGNGIPEMSGMYDRGEIIDGIPSYSNSNFTIYRKSLSNPDDKMWVISRKNGTACYQSSMMSSNISLMYSLVIPRYGWKAVDGGEGPVPIVYLVKPTVQPRTRKRPHEN